MNMEALQHRFLGCRMLMESSKQHLLKVEESLKVFMKIRVQRKALSDTFEDNFFH